MNENFVINIGRQLGSGGHEVGLLLAAALNIDFYDKELIEMAKFLYLRSFAFFRIGTFPERKMLSLH